MQISFSKMKNIFLPALLLTGASVLFSSCLKNDHNDVINDSVSGIMAFNLAPAKPNVGFAISGNAFTNAALAYTNFTGTYLRVYAGTGAVQSFDYNSNNIIASTNAGIEAGKYYSAFLVGKDSSYANVVVEDNLDSLPIVAGSAYVRFINAVADSTVPVVKISSNGTELISQPAAYKSVSAFKPVTAGDINVSISNEGSISSNRTISVEANKVYTILLSGFAGSSDPVNSVQVRYVTNGTIQ